MFNSNGFQNKFLGRMFRRIDGLVWDITTGKTGIKDSNGIYTIEATPAVEAVAATSTSAAVAAVAASFQVTVNPFDNFGMAIPAFATKVPHDKINIGDIVVGDQGIQGWVIEKLPVALRLMDKNGFSKTVTPPKVAIMGQEGALVVQNLFGLTGGAEGLAGLQGNLLPLLAMMGDNDSALEKILPLMLFSQTTGTGAGKIDPMMLMMMSGGLGSDSKIDPMMLMAMGGLGGIGGGLNPMMLLAMQGGGLEGLFGGSKNKVGGENANALGGAPALTPIARR